MSNGYYLYGMRLRPFGIACQPKKGFVQRLDDTTGRYWDILVYDRELTDKEVSDYDLSYIGQPLIEVQ